jgi:exosome complex RNA-binding protein Csl4
MRHLSFVAVAMALLSSPAVSEADETAMPLGSDQSKMEQQIGQGGSELGVPIPGTVTDQETTRKKRDPSRTHRADENAQVTMGGAQYFVHGQVLKIEGDQYFVREQESDDEIRLIVNTDTNLDCAAKPGEGDLIKGGERQQDQGMTDSQRMQGQRQDETARGSGFALGRCDFKPGDHVKADVSDLGTVTTLKFISDSSLTRSAGSFESHRIQTPGTATAKDTRTRAPQLTDVPGLKQDLANAAAPADLREEQPSADHQRGDESSMQARAGCPSLGDSLKGEVFRGKVTSVDSQFLVAKDKTGNEKRLRVDHCTDKGQIDFRAEAFKPGDRIEAYVGPDGHALSISLMRQQPHYGPGDPEAGA